MIWIGIAIGVVGTLLISYGADKLVQWDKRKKEDAELLEIYNMTKEGNINE